MNTKQLSLMDLIRMFSRIKKQSRAVATLAKIDAVVNRQALVNIVQDKAYTNDKHKRIARTLDIFYGVLDKKKKDKALSGKQQKRNKQKSSVRAAVEHPFAFMRKKLKMGLATAKNRARNAF